MFQISPSKEIILSWCGADPNDTDILYVQAVVQDALNLAVLQTINLVDRGNHLFSAGYITPQDPNQMGTGRQIIITMTVYTDSGYTIPSQNYSRISENYLVKKLVDASSFWGAGGSTFDAKALKKAVSDALKEMKFPEPTKQEFPVKAIVDAIKNELNKLPKPIEPEKIDFSPVHDRLDKVKKSIESLPLPTKPTDIVPLQKEMRAIKTSLSETVDTINASLVSELKKIEDMVLKENEKAVNTMIQTILTTIKDSIKDGSFKMTLFGNKNPFDQADAKKDNYLASLKAKYVK